MRTRNTGGLAAVLVTMMLSVLCAPGAHAHTRLVASSPVPDAVHDSALVQVRLGFDTVLSTEAAEVTVRPVGGTDLAAGAVSVADDQASVAVATPPGAGDYEVGYRVVAADGHPITGTYRFTLSERGADESADFAIGAAAGPGDASGTAWNPVGLLAMAAAGLVLLASLARRRRAERHDDDETARPHVAERAHASA